MTNPTEGSSQSRLYSTSVVLASLIIPAPIFAGKVAETIMKSGNPAGLDQLDVPLAYLSEILVTSFSVLALVVVAFLITVVSMTVRSRTIKSVALPLTIAIIQGVIGVVALVLGGVISGLEG